jgi:hypothetical protein
MNNHTPGPWFLDQYGHVYGWDVPQPHMGTSTSVHICTPVTNFADRALIAAAPTLLEALKMALEAPDDDRSWEDEAIAAIKAADPLWADPLVNQEHKNA